jgi:hypothetical protein
MKSHSRARVISTIFLIGSIALLGSAPASFAATKATPNATVKPNPKITALPTKAPGQDGGRVSGANRAGRLANLTATQKACLVKNGVIIPAARTGTARPTPAPNPSRTPGGFAARGTFNNPKSIAAFKKCGVALPTGGFGGQFNSAKFQAFQKCMTTAGFQSTGGFGRYDESDPSTVAALIKCQKSTGFTLPKPGQFGSNN